MDKTLIKYYEDRFDMMSKQGWTDLIEDTQELYNSLNNVSTIATEADLHFKKGQLDILQWILTLKDVSADSYEQLLSGDTANGY